MVIFINEDGSGIELDDFVRYLLKNKEYNQLSPIQEERLRLFLGEEERFIIGNVEKRYPHFAEMINNLPPRNKEESDNKEGDKYENH